MFIIIACVMFIVTGIVFLISTIAKGNAAESKKEIFLICLIFIVPEIILIIVGLLCDDKALGIACASIFAIAMSVAEYIRILTVFKCNEIISAKYIGYEKYVHKRKGEIISIDYCPEFVYKYNGVFYKEFARAALGKRAIPKYTKGEYYDVYIDPKNPKKLILKRRLSFADIIMFLLIAACAFVAVLLILG
ncbi:MAG: hypothetical protein J6C89_01620 [Clostridia bacterium]|nr:hypothetical protein [Clostridia bacterium]